MDTTLDALDGRSTLMSFWEAVERRDLEGMAAFAHDEVEMEWPQSGERFSGRDNAIGAMLATEEKGVPAGEPRIVGSGDVWTVVAPVRYGADPYSYVGLFEIADGKIRRAIEFFAPPFPANPDRARFADRADDAGSAD